VDGADEHEAEPVEEVLALRFQHLLGDAVLERGRRPLGEGEGDDLRRVHALHDEGGHPSGDCLGLPGTPEGVQFVMGDDNEPVTGQWLAPAGEPTFVNEGVDRQ
jgi:hypothetical protein